METAEIVETLNKHIFDREIAYLIESIASNPERFVGIFRSTTPQLKIIQNLLQSREIRFGDALEEIIGLMISKMGYIQMDKNLSLPDGNRLNCDQYFSNPDKSMFFLVEQKVRDDHDSSKKTGQFVNFKKKLEVLYKIHGDKLTGIMYFIDPSLRKNRNYYLDMFDIIKLEIGIDVSLCYNGELFEKLGHPNAWNALEQALTEWRDKHLPQEIELDLESYYDTDTRKIASATQSVELLTWKKLVENESLWKGAVIQVLFPRGTGLLAIMLDLENRYSTCAEPREQRKLSEVLGLLKKRIEDYYPSLNKGKRF